MSISGALLLTAITFSVSALTCNAALDSCRRETERTWAKTGIICWGLAISLYIAAAWVEALT